MSAVHDLNPSRDELRPLPVVRVEPQELDAAWQSFATLLGPDHPMLGEGAADEMRRLVIDGKRQIWLTRNGDTVLGGAMSELFSLPYGVVCVLWPVLRAGLDADYVGPIVAEVEAWAREQGCVAIEIRYYLPQQMPVDDYGYRKASESFVKDLRGRLS